MTQLELELAAYEPDELAPFTMTVGALMDEAGIARACQNRLWEKLIEAIGRRMEAEREAGRTAQIIPLRPV